MRRQKRSSRTSLWLIALLVILICGIVTFKRQELNIANAKSEARITELKHDIADEKDKAEEIKDKKSYMKTKQYIEDMAREKLGLVYKDEIIFKSQE